MKVFMLVVFVSALSGCNKAPESTTRVGSDFEVGKLFTIDNCTVYRFQDGGRARYFTNCKGSINWTEGCGKNCSQEMSVGGY